MAAASYAAATPAPMLMVDADVQAADAARAMSCRRCRRFERHAATPLPASRALRLRYALAPCRCRRLLFSLIARVTFDATP